MKKATVHTKAALYVEDFPFHHVWKPDPRETYLLFLFQQVQSTKYWTDPIKEFVKKPTGNGLRALMNILTDQYFDNPVAVRDVLGDELCAQFPVHSLRRAKESKLPYYDIKDLRALRRGRQFRMEANPGAPVYIVVANASHFVRYRLSDDAFAAVMKYPKNAGLAAVHV